MLAFLEDKERIKLTIIVELLQQNLNIIDLVKRYRVSEVTIDKYVAELKREFPYLSIVKKKRTLYFEEDCLINAAYFEAYFISRSHNLNLLKAIFIHGGHNIAYWQERLSISQSTFRRHISHLNEILTENFSFKIDLNPVMIRGNEADVRFFFYKLFRSDKRLLFEEISPDKIDEIRKNISSLSAQYSQHAYLIDQESLLGLALINWCRIQQSCPLISAEHNCEAAVNTSEEELLSDCFFPFFQDTCLLSFDQALETARTNRDVAQLIGKCQQLIRDSQSQWGLSFFDEEALVLVLINILTGIKFRLISACPQTIKNKTVLYQKLYPQLFTYFDMGIQDLMEEFCSHSSTCLKDYLVSYLFACIRPDSLSRAKTRKNVLLVLVKGKEFAEEITQLLQNDFPQGVCIHRASEEIKHYRNFNHLRYDLVVSQCPLTNIPPSKLVYIDLFPGQKELIYQILRIG
ncbi:helix-turn-helix domain-containing protein [Vaginisenegalia massiliensis]|uniref:helix-turn-helix domain-containing protein n=1 Tax=Vaginisenegalia massiliensis TaxID=2058294 RepID=UPI000F542719|nr:helix-turn-helix domain-containing protein [Vaginisenegalia massiliensis]